MKRVEWEQLSAGDEFWRMWGRGCAAENDQEVNFGSKVEFYVDVLQARLDDCAGFHSEAATRRLLAKLEEIDPGIVHLHNLHGYYVNVEILFDWLARHRRQVRWTLHDCWAFTGHCAHFLYIGCDRWRNGCHDCPQKHDYPASYILDSSARNYERKRAAFTSIAPERMILRKEIPMPKSLNGMAVEGFDETMTLIRSMCSGEERVLLRLRCACIAAVDVEGLAA